MDNQQPYNSIIKICYLQQKMKVRWAVNKNCAFSPVFAWENIQFVTKHDVAQS